MRVTTCRACGAAFPAQRTRAYCDACRASAAVRQGNAHRQGRNAVTRRPGMFIGVDGEGYTRPDGTHHYTMLSVGDATLTDPNGDHLKFPDIAAFLWEQYEANPDASFIGFFLGYDFTHWFATLPEKKAWRLLHKEGISSRKPATRANPVPWPVNYAGWEFDVLGSKRFKLRKEGSKNWMFVNDCGAYFQKSFLATIDPRQWADPVCTQREYDIIVEGKNVRADVQTPEQWVAGYDQTARYNRMENRILAIVMDRVKTGLVAEGIELDRDQWFGPGQAAQAWLQTIHQPGGVAARSTTPQAAADAAQASYYGGWFECFVHGHLAGETYEYDINSAYPTAMTHLPCPVHGAWKRATRSTLDHPYRLCHVRVTGSHPVVGAMQCRRPDGTIARPHVVQGWYWAHELRASRAAGFIDKIQWFDAWTWTPGKCPGSFSHEGKEYRCTAVAEQIAGAYNRRLEVGKNTAHGIALKITINSVYGKLAQSIGKPKFGNAFAASFITSRCRTQILEAITTHPSGADALAMVATDACYFREPHPHLDLTPGALGAWEQSVKHNLTILKPGVYWDDKARTALLGGELPKLKSRGINSRDLAANLARIDEEFSSPQFRRGEHWPTITLTKNFNHINAKAAITRGNWALAGQIEWQDGVPHQNAIRTESATPVSKRSLLRPIKIDHRGDLRLQPWHVGTVDGVSCPYDERFGRMAQEDPNLEYENPDGDLWTPNDLL